MNSLPLETTPLDMAPKAKVAGMRLLTLSGIPTLGAFGAMTREEKVAWVDSHVKEAKVLGLAKTQCGTVELAGISGLGLRQSVFRFSNKQCDWLAFALRHLEVKPLTVNNRGTERAALELWGTWQVLPLNELKFALVNEAKKGLSHYFSPVECLKRDARSEHRMLMDSDPEYAFQFIRSKIRGEVDVMRVEYPGATENDIAEAQRMDDLNTD